MRALGLAAIVLTTGLGAGGAAAQTPAAPASAVAPVCTTTTIVVRRGDQVLSTTSNTKCEEPAAAAGGGGVSARAVFAAPAGALDILGKSISPGGGEAPTARNVRGDWRVLDSRAQRVCHLFLTSQADPAGFHVRRTDCEGLLERAQAWTFDDGAVLLHAPGGDLVVRLGGDRDHLGGVASDGQRVALER